MLRLMVLVVGAVAMQTKHIHNETLSPVPGYIHSDKCQKWYNSATFHDEERVAFKKVYRKQLRNLAVFEVIDDLSALFTKVNECWPADWNNYGPFFVRLAWHCSGTYRKTDGAGGCGGGRIRFLPEAGWEDNGNLDKARALLKPIKDKYGKGLSWGDLYTLAGTIAIRDMGGPVKQFCFGREDDGDNTSSLMLTSDCHEETGKCDGPSGQLHPGLIYVNPEGPDGNPNPYLSAKDVKGAFGRMGMTFSQTVALIGGGHAFGKAHGACKVAPCGSGLNQGLGSNTKTSGFEGPWTTNPTKWDNEYFQALISERWVKFRGEGGKWQWKTANPRSKYKNSRMLTSDYALVVDRDYNAHVRRFAKSQAELDVAFAEAWFALTTNGKGWVDKRVCVAL